MEGEFPPYFWCFPWRRGDAEPLGTEQERWGQWRTQWWHPGMDGNRSTMSTTPLPHHLSLKLALNAGKGKGFATRSGIDKSSSASRRSDMPCCTPLLAKQCQPLATGIDTHQDLWSVIQQRKECHSSARRQTVRPDGGGWGENGLLGSSKMAQGWVFTSKGCCPTGTS